MATLKDVPIDKCVVSEENSRSELGDLSDLIASISEVGVLEPLLGKDLGNKEKTVEIFCGARRLAASTQAGLKVVPVILHPRRSVTKQTMLIRNIAENVQRKDLNPMDEAEALKRLQTDHKMSQEEICAQIGIKKARLQQRFRLLGLEDSVKAAITQDRITPTAAFEIDRLPKNEQGKFVKVAEELSGNKLKALVDRRLEKLESKRQKKLPGTEGSGEEEAAMVKELLRAIRKCSTVLAESLEYNQKEVGEVKDIDFKELCITDLQILAEFLDGLADKVPEKIEFNKQAEEEIVEKVEGLGDSSALDLESPTVRQALIQAIRNRSIESAKEDHKGDGLPKVTYDIVSNVFEEFFVEDVSEE